MALVKYGAIVAEIRGKESGVVFSRNAYGAYVRNKTSPINPQTSFQQQQRAYMGAVAQQWSGLTEGQKAAWGLLGEQVVRTNRLGDQTQYTGFNLFMRCNRNRSILGLAIITEPVTPPALPALQLDRPTIQGTDGGISVFTIGFTPTPIGEGIQLVVDATPPVLTGRRFFKNMFRLITVSNANAATNLSIISAYNTRFTLTAPVGAVVAVRVRLVHTSSGFDTAPAMDWNLIESSV
jgi:hypothetical protein